MNDLTFGATLLSLFVVLAAAVADEANRMTVRRTAAPVIGNSIATCVRVASVCPAYCICAEAARMRAASDQTEAGRLLEARLPR